MSANFVHISEDRVRQLLDWEATVTAVQSSLVAVSEKRIVQNPRSFTTIPNTSNLLLCMPGYLQAENGGLGCKMVTVFSENEKRQPPLPKILANILLFNEDTGELQSIIQATTITAWRTAAASVVATKCLHAGRDKNVLGIIGAGTQGRIHAIAFHKIFGFKEIRIYNRTNAKAERLVTELKAMGIPAKYCTSGQECVKDADVIVTATFSSTPVVKFDWIKKNVFINAVGAGQNHHSELEESIYKNSTVYVDHMESAKTELAGLEKMGVPLKAEVGEVILKKVPAPGTDGIIIFHSLGLAVEDVAVGKMIYDRFIKENK